MKIAKVISEQEGLSPEKAQEIWDAFEKFGGYAFNKSHSVAYSLISYQSMWLKTHYPAEFFAAAFEDSVELIGTILKLVRDEELIPADAPICIVADSLASMVPNSKAEKFDKMAEGTAKDKDQLNMNDNTALARATSANLPTLALWARKYNACIIFLNQVRTKIGVMFGDPTTSPGGDSPKFYASVRIRLGASVMKDGKDKIGQDVGAECIKNKVAPPFGKCSWKFYFDPTRGLDVIESLVEHMLEEGYLPKNASGRVEIGDKKYTKSQIVDMYRDKPLPEIIAALQAIDERRAKESASAETEEA